LYLQRNETIKALAFVQARIDSDPNNSELFLFRAQTELHSNKPAEAERSLTRSLELKSDSPEALILLAQTQAALQQIDSAMAS